MTKYYIDTSIWVDYQENRVDRFRPLGEWAFELFKLINKNKDIILYSNFIILELEKLYDKEKIKKMFEVIDNFKLLQKVDFSEEQYKEAMELAKKKNIAPFDAIHSILARDNNAIMVTRDVHFYELQEIVAIKKPEDII